MTFPRFTCTALGCLAFFGVAAFAQEEAGRRLALVIGNQNYPKKPLCAAVNDAADVSARLKELGFAVAEVHDADLSRMFAAFTEFQNHKLAADDKVVFFFAGHGIDAEGQNFLLPVDFERHKEAEVRKFAFPVSRVLEGLRGAGSSIVIIDACRTRELDFDSKGDGLAPFVEAGNSLIISSASPDQEAKEGVCAGEHPNGVFTKALLQLLARPGLSIEAMFSELKTAVEKESGGDQRPSKVGALKRPFVFHRADNCSSTPDNEESADSLIKAAECALKQRKAGKAVALAEQAVALQEGSAEGRWVLGRARLADGAPDEALADLAKSVELDATNPRYRFELGALLLELKQYKRAQEELIETRRLAPDWPGLCLKLAESYELTSNRPLAAQIRASCR